MAEVSRQRFLGWFAELADIGRTDTGWNRVAWTPLEAEAQRWFTAAAESVGLQARRDGAGSVWAVTPDADDGPWTCAGSHLDTQPDGGAYDGALGVVCALEAAAAIVESGVERRRPLAVVSFVDEEGARFRTACFASLAITGRLDIDEALAAMNGAEAIHGVTRESLLESRAQLQNVESYLEVHVEQGKALVDRGLALGIADVLTPRQRWRAVFTGESDHAGTRAMAGRRDALVAAAPFIVAVSEEAGARPGAVGTVGRLRDRPGLDELDPRPRRVPPRRPRARGRDDRRPRRRASGALPRGGAHARVAKRRRRLRRRPSRRASRRRGAPRRARRRPALLRRPRCGHPGAARPGGDALRPKPDGCQPHAGRVGVRRRLRGGGTGACRCPRSAAHRSLSGLWRSMWKSREGCGRAAPGRRKLAHIAKSGLWETRVALDGRVWKGRR